MNIGDFFFSNKSKNIFNNINQDFYPKKSNICKKNYNNFKYIESYPRTHTFTTYT